MYPDLFEFLCQSQSTCHCLIYCLKKISIEALLLGTYYFMCKGAFYQLRLVRVYVTRCFWVEKKFLVTFAIFAKFEAFSRPFSACSCSKSRILLNLLFYFIFRVFVTRCFQVARKILVNFAIFAGFPGPFLAYSLSNSRIF